MKWKVPFSDVDIGSPEIRAVGRVLKSRWLTMGSVTQEFERRFAAKMGVRHAVAVNNCTAALHLANAVLGIGPGDEVICPALTFVASANASRYLGASVVFADVVSERDLTVDPESVRKAVTSKTRAVTVVHYAGFPCLMDGILAVAKEHGLKVIEDCAHAPFGTCVVGGKRAFVGAIGDIGCFSFFGNKNMTTGEGGMITTNDDMLAERLRLLRSHGMTTLSYQKKSGHAGSYDVVDLGYNYRTDEIHSAVGLCQLDKIDRLNASRRNAYGHYRRLLAGRGDLVVPFADRDLGEATCHLMPVLFRSEPSAVRQRLLDHGVQTSRHYIPIPEFTLYGRQTFASRVPNLAHLVSLPMFAALKPSQIEYVVSLL